MGTILWYYNKKEKDLTTRQAPLSLRPISSRYETINGHTPMMLATMSNKCGILGSFVRMAPLREGRDATQSRVSTPFSLGEGIQTLKNTRDSSLQASLLQTEIEDLINDQLLPGPITRETAESLCQGIGATKECHHRYVRAKGIYYATQNGNFNLRVSTLQTQSRGGHPLEHLFLPCPQEDTLPHPACQTQFRNSNAVWPS